MKGNRAAHRYARSLLALSLENNELDQNYQGILTVLDVCRENREMRNLLKSPVIKTDKKLKILEAVFKGRISKTVLHFIRILGNKKREFLLEEIAFSFIEQYKKECGIRTLNVSTAVALDETLRRSIISVFDKEDPGSVEIFEHIDPRLIGGFIIQTDNFRIDASIRHKLDKLKRTMQDDSFVRSF